MRKLTLTLLFFAISGQCSHLVARVETNAFQKYYVNPLQVSMADPYVLREGDTFFLYGTTSDAKIEVFTSADLVNWDEGKVCYERSDGDWGNTNFWAPEVIKQGDHYRLYFAARNYRDDMRNIVVATSSSPHGPFVQEKAPLFPQYSLIDPHVFYDRVSDSHFMYVTVEGRQPSQILGAKLKPSLNDIEGTWTECLVPTEEWEDLWIEAPFIIERDGHYFMTYSGSAYWEPAYAIGVAVSEHPLGPWKKLRVNPIIKATSDVEGPGHNCIINSPDDSEMFVMYHRHLSPYTTRRVLALDRIAFNAGANNGASAATIAPTTTLQTLPSGAPAVPTAASDFFDADQLDRDRWMIVAEDQKNWSLTSSTLKITTQDGDIWRSRDDARNIFLQHAPATDFTLSTTLTFAPGQNHEQAGLLLFSDSDNYFLFTVDYSDGLKLMNSNERGGKNETRLYSSTLGSRAQLQVTKKGNVVTCYAGAPGSPVEQVGSSQTLKFHVRKVGLFAASPGSERAVDATFHDFGFHAHPPARH